MSSRLKPLGLRKSTFDHEANSIIPNLQEIEFTSLENDKFLFAASDRIQGLAKRSFVKLHRRATRNLSNHR